ncbi:MAG: cyclic nucleotide-binding domain-containing protein [Gemmatimonadota bacterium]
MTDFIDPSILAKSPIFADLSEAELARVARICQVEELKWDTYVFHEGDEGDRMYIIAKGAVRISRQVPGTGEEAITVLKEGACFGEMAVLDPSTRSTDAIVDSKCELVTITRADFETLLESDYRLAYKILRAVVRLLSERLRITNDSLRSIMVIAMF